MPWDGKRIAQLEDELAGQQRQLDTMRKALSQCIDVATHRLLKEQMTIRIDETNDRLVSSAQEQTMTRKAGEEKLAIALTNKAEALALENYKKEMEGFAQDWLSTGESHFLEVKQELHYHRSKADTEISRYESLLSSSRADIDALEQQHKSLARMLTEKAAKVALAENENRLRIMEGTVQTMEKTLAEGLESQVAATVNAEMNNEVLHQANAAAIEKQVQELEATREDLANLEQRMMKQRAEQVEHNEQAIAERDEWYKEKDHEQYLLAVARKERQDNQLVQALAKKADVSWYEQQKAIIDATQVSLTAMKGEQQDIQVSLADKVDTLELEKFQRKLQREISEARQDTSEVSQRLDNHREHLDLARAQLLETIRQQGDTEASLSMKADKADWQQQNEQLENLFDQVAQLEQRQDSTQQWVAHLQEQMMSAARHASKHSSVPHNAGHHPQMSPSNNHMINNGGLPPALPHGLKGSFQPPPSPSERY
jgi:hypothetical protein